MVIQSDSVDIMQKQMDVLYKNVLFKLTLSVSDLSTGNYVYLVENIDELIEDSAFHSLLKDWRNKR